MWSITDSSVVHFGKAAIEMLSFCVGQFLNRPKIDSRTAS